MPHLAWIAIAPIKGLALALAGDATLGPDGVAENRRFYLVDEDGRRYGLLRDGRLAQVEAATDPEATRLSLRFPDGTVIEGEVALGAQVGTDFYGRPVEGRLVEGPWSDALSGHAGRPVRLVRAERPGGGLDRGRGTVTLVSQASVDRLAAEAGAPVDPRRFRMLLGIDGCAAHDEDGWIGSRVAVGEAVVRPLDTVARCAITTKDPATGVSDLDTLRLIAAYRGRDGDGQICFGVWGEVVESGRIRVGDPVEPL